MIIGQLMDKQGEGYTLVIEPTDVGKTIYVKRKYNVHTPKRRMRLYRYIDNAMDILADNYARWWDKHISTDYEKEYWAYNSVIRLLQWVQGRVRVEFPELELRF